MSNKNKESVLKMGVNRESFGSVINWDDYDTQTGRIEIQFDDILFSDIGAFCLKLDLVRCD